MTTINLQIEDVEEFKTKQNKNLNTSESTH